MIKNDVFVNDSINSISFLTLKIKTYYSNIIFYVYTDSENSIIYNKSS